MKKQETYFQCSGALRTRRCFIPKSTKPLAHSILISISLSIFSALSLMACGSHSAISANEIAERAADTVGCSSFEDDLWDQLYQLILAKRSFPSASEIRTSIGVSLNQGRLKTLGNTEKTELQTVLTDLYQTIAIDSIRVLNNGKTPDTDRALEILSALELGDRSTLERDQLQTKINDLIEQAQALGALNTASCPSSPNANIPIQTSYPTDNLTLLGHWQFTRPALVYGGLKSLATAYQSCEVGSLRPVDDAVGGVRGISVIGTHPDGIGKIRAITDLSTLLRTDYYLSRHRTPSSQCFDVEKNPLIYNYGGKPGVSKETDSTLDFFKRSGSGGPSLGIDCSAYVYSAFAAAGLRVKKNGRLKAIDVHGISSTMLNNPELNGLSCLAKPQFTASHSLQAGDVIAEDGHVVIVAAVGEDPFGIKNLTNESDCRAGNIRVSRYQFTILQSAPVLGGIGINQMEAKAYFADSSVMSLGVVDQAISACIAHVRKTSIQTKSIHANVVRHSGTPECLDTPIHLNHEECLDTCPALD